MIDWSTDIFKLNNSLLKKKMKSSFDIETALAKNKVTTSISICYHYDPIEFIVCESNYMTVYAGDLYNM